MQTQVLVVGAGPVGLTSAIGLAKAGLEVTIVDAAEFGKNGSRAAVIQANTLEVCHFLTHCDHLIFF
jgi:2-polyprenyl-6-methoxyphenol hydroxylase-like FAD-dependent oxidoreductase